MYDPAVVRSLLAERERNSWSLGELSRRSGIPVGTLGTWSAKERLSREAAESREGFTEVVMAPAAVAARTARWTAEFLSAAAPATSQLSPAR